MANFVLVSGAWLGAWAWDDVVPALREGGHGVHPLTLSGVSDRKDAPVGPQTHVQDVVGEIERLDLRDVVLVGHSYSGIPVGQAAARIGDRLARVVFVDANVPSEGESFVSTWWDGAEKMEAALAENGGDWAVPEADDFEGQDLSAERIAEFLAKGTPHPGAALTDRAVLVRPLAELPATYIKCLLDGEEPNPDVAALLKSEHWRLVRMDTGHWPMLSQPADLARILLEIAEG